MIKNALQVVTRFSRTYAHIVVALLVLVGVLWYFGVGQTTAAWYSGGGGTWDKRVKITIQASQVNSTLTDFPVYVDLSNLPADFHTNVRSDGGDIRVATADGETEVPRELVFYDAATDTGQLHFKAPSISASSNTEFYIYYGNGSATDYATNATFGAENVWTNGYDAVLHLNEVVNNDPDGYIDSTGNGYDGTGSSMSIASPSGKLSGTAAEFDGSNNMISLGTYITNNTQTFSAWIKWGGNGGNYNVPLGLVGSDGSSGYEIAINRSSGDLWWANDQSWAINSTGHTIPSNGTWEYVNLVYNSTTGTKIYAGATNVDTNITTGTQSSSGILGIGKRGDDQLPYHGVIDEVRISSLDRSSDWISAEYTNQNTPTSFYAVGTQEDKPTPPIVTTGAATNIATSSATANGEITNTGGADASERGFVYSTTSRTDPGNTSPAASAYESAVNEAGTFSTGAYSLPITGLAEGTTYYTRAYAQNSEGYSYGDEVSFVTNAESGEGGESANSVIEIRGGEIRGGVEFR